LFSIKKVLTFAFLNHFLKQKEIRVKDTF